MLIVDQLYITIKFVLSSDDDYIVSVNYLDMIRITLRIVRCCVNLVYLHRTSNKFVYMRLSKKI